MEGPTDTHQADVPPPYEPWSHCVGPGWQQELVDPFLTLVRECGERTGRIYIAQIKEKFGTLRIYVDGPPWVQKIADALEHLSASLCEDCGCRDGFTYGAGSVHELRGPDGTWLAKVVDRKQACWIRTLCQECRIKWEAER